MNGRRLALRRETLADLSAGELGQVAGAAAPTLLCTHDCQSIARCFTLPVRDCLTAEVCH